MLFGLKLSFKSFSIYPDYFQINYDLALYNYEFLREMNYRRKIIIKYYILLLNIIIKYK